jgi:hypothetical protein
MLCSHDFEARPGIDFRAAATAATVRRKALVDWDMVVEGRGGCAGPRPRVAQGLDAGQRFELGAMVEIEHGRPGARCSAGSRASSWSALACPWRCSRSPRLCAPALLGGPFPGRALGAGPVPPQGRALDAGAAVEIAASPRVARPGLEHRGRGPRARPGARRWSWARRAVGSVAGRRCSVDVTAALLVTARQWATASWAPWSGSRASSGRSWAGWPALLGALLGTRSWSARVLVEGVAEETRDADLITAASILRTC